jgi:hypothetical protein
MRRLPKSTFLCLLILTITACSQAPQQSSQAEKSAAGSETNPKQSAAQTISYSEAEQSQNVPTITARKIIRNANLTLETPVTDDAQRKITSIAEAKNGFVVDTTQEKGGFAAASNKTVQMTIRVPAEQFEQALTEIRALANRVTTEKISGEDVTEKFVDLEARLRTKMALETQFFEILKQARTVGETLEIQQKLGDVRSEIEQLQGQLRLLQNQASLSTIRIRLETPMSFSSSLSNFFANLGDTVAYGFSAALYLIIGLIWLVLALSPFAILIGVPLWLWRRSSNQKRQREKLAQQIAQEEKHVGNL